MSESRLSDGSTATETLTEYTNGTSVAYELTAFTNILGWLACGVRGRVDVRARSRRTLIRWTYEFEPRPLRRTLVRVGLAPLWRR